MSGREVNLNAADQLMRVGSEALARNIKSEVDAAKAEKVMKMEDVIVNKLIPMKKSGEIDSRQFIKSVIKAGHDHGLDRNQSLNTVLALEKVNQLLQNRANTSLSENYDIDYKKYRARKTRAEAIGAELKLAQGPSEEDYLNIQKKRADLEAAQRRNVEARQPAGVRAANEALAKHTGDTVTATITAIENFKNMSRELKGKSSTKRLELLQDQLGNVYKDAGIEWGWFENNQAKSFRDLAEKVADALKKTPEFVHFERDQIVSALEDVFTDPNADTGAVLQQLLTGSPIQKDDSPTGALFRTLNQ